MLYDDKTGGLVVKSNLNWDFLNNALSAARLWHTTIVKYLLETRRDHTKCINDTLSRHLGDQLVQIWFHLHAIRQQAITWAKFDKSYVAIRLHYATTSSIKMYTCVVLSTRLSSYGFTHLNFKIVYVHTLLNTLSLWIFCYLQFVEIMTLFCGKRNIILCFTSEIKSSLSIRV